MLSTVTMTFISFINLFFAPVVCLYIYYRRHHLAIKASAELFCRYAVICMIHLPFTRVFAIVMGKILNDDVWAESTQYSIAALAAAVILAFAIEVVEKFLRIEVQIERMDEAEGKGKNDED